MRTAISPRLAMRTFVNIGGGKLIRRRPRGPPRALAGGSRRRARRSRGRGDHPGADGAVAVLVDQDEAAGATVAGVGVEYERGARAQAHAADVVELELLGRVGALQRVDVDDVVDRLDDRLDGVRGLLDQVARAGAQRAVG